MQPVHVYTGAYMFFTTILAAVIPIMIISIVLVTLPLLLMVLVYEVMQKFYQQPVVGVECG